jgi:signal peptide peptidase SppA
MIKNLIDQILVMEPKAARTLIGSYSKTKNAGVNVFDADGKISDTEKPRIVQSSASYYGADNSYKSKPFLFVDGIAIIPVSGALIHNLGYISSYWSGYDAIVRMFDAANLDAEVQGILLLVNSPGGTVAGCFDACDHMFESKGSKPVWSMYDDMACSGAMCIGSVADRRFTTQTAISGSIGVVQIHASMEQMLTDIGYDITLIYSGDHKVDGNPYKNLPDEVYAEFKAQCDTLRSQFSEKVARNVGISVDQVMATEAKTYTGQEAVDAGLADEVVNSHNIISIFKQHLSVEGSVTNRSVTMSEQQGNVTSESVTTEAETQTTSLEVTAAVETVSTESEQQRCEAIVTSEDAKGNPALANHLAFKTNMSAEQAIEALKVSAVAPAQESSANPLDAAMASTEQPNITAMSEDSEPSEAEQIVASFKTVVGDK